MIEFLPSTGLPGFRVGLMEGPPGFAIDEYSYGDAPLRGSPPSLAVTPVSLPEPSLEIQPRIDPGPSLYAKPPWQEKKWPLAPWLLEWPDTIDFPGRWQSPPRPIGYR
jgi:hypothetical protein